MNHCVYCGSEDVEIKEKAENKILEVCSVCGEELIYDRIKVGKKAKQSYIGAVIYALDAQKQPKVMITAAGKRRLTLLDALYALNGRVKIVEWNQQQTELGGLELRVILKRKEDNNTNIQGKSARKGEYWVINPVFTRCKNAPPKTPDKPITSDKRIVNL